MSEIFKITIGSSPSKSTDSKISEHLGHDLYLIKAALLYADKIDVCSPMGNFVCIINSFRKLAISKKFEDKIKLLEEINKQSSSRPEISQLLLVLNTLKHRNHLSKDEILLKINLEKEIEKLWHNQFNNDLKIQAGDSLNDIMKLIDDGLISYFFFDVNEENIQEELLKQFTDYIADSISDPYSYPLLDDLSGLFIQDQIHRGKIHVKELDFSRSKQVALAAKLFERLPNFDLANIDEIIDIRNELHPHLSQFRSSMIKFSESMKTSQFSNEFEKEVEYLFRKEIDPSIKNIEDEVKSKSYLKQLVSRFSEKPHLFPLPIFGIAVAGQYFNYEITSLIIEGVTLSANLLDVYNKLKEEKSYIEKDQLFFYYKAKKLLL